jgi:hypothetical protein
MEPVPSDRSRTFGGYVKEKLVIGIIVDTTNPQAAERLLCDIGAFVQLDQGFEIVEVVLLENPSDGENRRLQFVDKDKITVHYINRHIQQVDRDRGLFGNLTFAPGRLPISTARTMVQRYAYARTQHHAACVWILDEDLRLHPLLDAIRAGNSGLSETVKRLRNERIDVAIGPVFGAPPLPARSSIRVNLEDILRHLHAFDELGPKCAWPDWSAENARVRAHYTEYYYDFATAHDDPGLVPYWMEPQFRGETVASVFTRLVASVPGLVDGVPVTRCIPIDCENGASSFPLARGGNTVFINPSLLGRLPNMVPVFDGRACRRSDMVWARLATHLEGARFARIPLAVWHDRTGPGRSSFDSNKLLDDARGSAFVRALDALIAEGALISKKRVSSEAASQSAQFFGKQLGLRLDVIRRSEDRAQTLLEQMDTYLSTILNDPAFVTGKKQLSKTIANLRSSMSNRLGIVNVEVDTTVVERFFLDMHQELAGYSG